MALSIAFAARNLYARKLTTAITALGMALVSFVFGAVLMMANGLQRTLVATGSPDNLLITRRGAQSEIQSSISRYQAAVIATSPAIATAADGSKLISPEPLVLLNLKKKGSQDVANIVVRGVGRHVLTLRPQVHMIAGRLFRPGTSEIVIGQAIASGFVGSELGHRLHFAMRDWTVVGIFDAGNSGFDSEIWGDSEQMMQAFRRLAFSTVLLQVRTPSHIPAIRRTLESDPRLNVTVEPETRFYADQSERMATFIRVLGSITTGIFSIGAIIGATITMHASVANRTAEIGTLRALGFQRRDILLVFLFEAMLIGACGGAVGLAAASLMSFVRISTTNVQTFSEIVFYFRLNAEIAASVLAFAMLMGFSGGFLPALRAARLNIVDALRAV